VLFARDQDFNLQSEVMKKDIQVRQYIPHQDLVQFISPDEDTIQGIILN